MRLEQLGNIGIKKSCIGRMKGAVLCGMCVESITLGSQPDYLIVLSGVKILILLLGRFIYCKEDAHAFLVRPTLYNFRYNVLTIRMHN